MSPASYLSYITKRILIAVFAISGVLLKSQIIIDKKNNEDSTVTKADELIKNKLSETKTLLMEGREEEAEVRVEKDLLNSTPSSEVHQSKAADFIRVAISAQLGGDTKTVVRAVRHALVQLDKAEALSKEDPAALAGIAELRGFIKERLAGSSAEAAVEYKAALSVDKESESARNKMSLLQKDSNESIASLKDQAESK